MRRIAFIDRDGTIIDNTGFVNTVADALKKEFVPGALKGLLRLQAMGYTLVMATNQGGIGAGFLAENTAHAINGAIVGRLFEHGITFEGVMMCPHHPSANCGCRKPKPGMFYRAVQELDADLKQSIMVGDQECDHGAAGAAGLRTFFWVRPTRGWRDMYLDAVKDEVT